MTNHDKNMRTLIVCFVLLILALVPLRFVEVKNVAVKSKTQVLGEETSGEIELPNAEIDLSKCFLEGMGYVALSRLRSLKGLRLMGINNLAFRVNPRALEIDKIFRKLSKQTSAEIKKMRGGAVLRRQKLFIKYLCI